jgi:hypothetical protein
MRESDLVRRLMSLLPIVAALALTSCKPMGMQAKQYSGDGTLRACSKLIGQGYAIEFAPFDATKPYLASYRLSHVPQVRRDPYVYLRFHSGPSVSFPEDLRKRGTAVIWASLVDTYGREKHSLDLSLSSGVWEESQGLFSAYALDQSQFHFEPQESYILTVSYKPGAVPPPATNLYFEIDDCAHY